MSELVNITIDGKNIQVPSNYTVLEAAKSANIKIPTLCYLKGINEIGACRICVVDVGARSLQAACVFPVSEGLNVKTNTPEVIEARKVTLELILSNHDRKCLTCIRNGNCELQKLSEELNITDIRYDGPSPEYAIDDFSPSIVRDQKKCILCRRCVSACKNVQTVSVIDAMERGFNTIVGSAFEKSLADVPCVNCGQCIAACPVGALKEKDSISEVWAAIKDPEKHVVVQTAPAVRIAIGEEFGMPIGTRATGQMIESLRRLGFDAVFDTDTAADLTIMEEGTELLNRIKNGGKLPLITSCSPGWIKFCEHNFPDFLDNLSSCKSPHQMFGALLKSYYAQKQGIDPSKIFVVSVMPCTAKKFECQRDELGANGYADVDAVITTREAARMIKEAGVDFANLPKESHFDNPFGDASGAGIIFGATGGVMEAALRTVYEILTGEELKELDFNIVRGTDGIKEAEVEIAGQKIRAAVAHGLGNARKLLDQIKNGEKQFEFIEIMACPGGCVTGGGQPIVPAYIKSENDVAALRAKATYEEDAALPIRKSHENPIINELYKDFLGEPCGHKSHELLHTHYVKRDNY